ncbi:nuclear transport factor 2 family protein [Mycobacterium interjectum]|uniref:nuclear transport factor 2 family protein n=1 Tax=Mycobacterium interjectum TaxID=33895 RepID=UPI00082BADD2|nr:nuclear transport factor 2 family protein [Mycobacterium interjectum]MCV7090185.1 nuclear transport factor 2 family protein [Mycobacterium interjectum]
MPTTTAETILDVADRLFAAIERGDVVGVDRLWSNDVAVWRVGARRGPTASDDKGRAMRVIDWFVTATTQRRYEILDRQLFDGGFVQQHILHATGHAGQSISMRVCIVIRVGTGGLIDRIDEYFDPAEIAPLLG